MYSRVPLTAPIQRGGLGNRPLFCLVIGASSDSVTVEKKAVIESLLFWADIESLKWMVIKSFCKMIC